MPVSRRVRFVLHPTLQWMIGAAALVAVPWNLDSQSRTSERVEQLVAQAVVQRFRDADRIMLRVVSDCRYARSDDDKMCDRGRMRPEGPDTARARTQRFAQRTGLAIASSSADVREWRDTNRTIESLHGCTRPMPSFTFLTPVSTVETRPDREWVVRVFASTYPKDQRCEGWGVLLEYTALTQSSGGSITLSEAKSIAHFSGMSPR